MPVIPVSSFAELVSRNEPTQVNEVPQEVPDNNQIVLPADPHHKYGVYQRKRVLVPCHLIDVKDYGLQGVMSFFESQGWAHLLTEQSKIYPELVRIFYANLNVQNDAATSIIRN